MSGLVYRTSLPAKLFADNLKDLLRFLRRDDPQTRDVFKQVCKWNTVSKDLIPIIEHCQDDYNLVLNAGRFRLFLHLAYSFFGEGEVPDEFYFLFCFHHFSFWFCSKGFGVPYDAY